MEAPICRDMLEFAASTHFLSVFKGRLRLGAIDAAAVEAALVQPLVHVETLENIHVGMLRPFASKSKDVTGTNWARKLMARYETQLSAWEPRGRGEVEKLLEDKDDSGSLLHYQLLPLRTKVLLLHELCSDLSEEDVIRQHMKDVGAKACRAQLVGTNTDGRQLLVLGTRLYEEVPAEFSGRFHNRKMKASGQLRCIAVSLEEWENAIEGVKASTAAEAKLLARKLEKEAFPPVEQKLRAKIREERRKQRSTEIPTKRSHRILVKELSRKAEEQELEERRAAREREMAIAQRAREQEEEERKLAASRAARFAVRLARQAKAASPTNSENDENYPKRRSARQR